MKKPRQYEDEPEPNYIAGTGSYSSSETLPGKVKTRQIGFIRQKKAKQPKRLQKSPR